MNSEGYGANGVPFEYTVEKTGRQRSLRRYLLILAYVVWVIAVFVAGVLIKLILPLLCFIPLSLWIIIFFTWRYTKEEMKITLFGGDMTVTRLFDGKAPRVLAKTKIKDIKILKPYSPRALAVIGKDNIIYATRNDTCDGAYILAFGNTALVAEINDKAMKILKYYNEPLFEYNG